MPQFLSNLCEDILITHSSDNQEMKHTHTHQQYELYFCTLPVRQRSIINGVEYKYDYPCVIISPPYTIHAMSCDDPEAPVFDRYIFYFNKNFFDLFAKSIIPDSIKCQNSGLFIKLTEEQALYLKGIISASDPQNESESEIVLALLLNKLVSLCTVENVLQIDSSSSYLQDVLMYISQNFAEEITPVSISKKFAVSRSKLDRDFKLYTGSSVREFINSCRLNQAKILLECNSDRYISDFAKECGFQSETYFFQFIKKHIGMTATEYRKSRKISSKYK